MFRPKHIIVGIDPAGIGKTGVIIKSYNFKYPKNWRTTIESTCAVEAALKIEEFINSTRSKIDEDHSLGDIVVEIPHCGNEFFTEVKATRELVGILKYLYRDKFKGHLPNHKNKQLKESIKNSKKYLTGHEVDAECILQAHLFENQTNLFCENYRGIKYGSHR